MRIASGQSQPGADWQVYTGPGGPGIFIDVDTSSGGFTSTPTYVTSLGGGSTHWALTGGSAVYSPSPTGFRVYVRFSDGGPITPELAAQNGWHVSWIGLEAIQVTHFAFGPFVETFGIPPGEERSQTFGPSNFFFGKALTWTVRPSREPGETRGMEITQVVERSAAGADPNINQEFVRVTVRNTGPNFVFAWFLFLGAVGR